MNMKQLRMTFCSVSALVLATLGSGAPPTPDQALEFATSVVLVKRVVQDNQIHSYVKEVWRFDSSAGPLLPVGSAYGRPRPYDSRMRFPERDAIVFEFRADRPKGLPNRWVLPVTEDGRVSTFLKEVDYGRKGLRGVADTATLSEVRSEAMSVDEVRMAVKSTQPKLEPPNKTPEPPAHL